MTNSIRDILEQVAERSFVVNCHGEFDLEALRADKDYAEAETALNAYILGEVMEMLKDEHHITIDTGVSIDMCDIYKDSNLTCNCPTGERNDLRQELRNKANKKFGGKS